MSEVDDSCQYGGAESLLTPNGTPYSRCRLTCHAGGFCGRGEGSTGDRGAVRTDERDSMRGGG